MATALHFSSDGERAACGARVFLCSDYTDRRDHVDCGRCKRTKQFANYDPSRFNVDIWNHEGDVIRWFKSVTAEEVGNIMWEYEDNPTVFVDVQEIG